MSAYDKKSFSDHGDSEDSNERMPNLPSLSAEDSGISPHFLHKAENLSDSEDESKSNVTSIHNSDDEVTYKVDKPWVNETAQPNVTKLWHYGSDVSSSSKERSPKKSKKRMNDGDEEESTKKKIIMENGNAAKPVFSSAAKKLMERMGFQEGAGLGKHGQGRTAPVEASKQKGRRGLGAIIAETDRSLIVYDPSKDKTDVHEDVFWLDGGGEINLSTEDLCSWIVVGPKKKILDDETEFCDPRVLKTVLICKNAFDKMTGEELRKSRNRSNPYELIRKGPFLNRAAMKMANMDSVFDEMFTKPVDEYGNPMVQGNELLYFADVCAGPGGFSEYVLSRKKWRAKGFGFTLKGDNDFKLSDFYSGPCESFEPFYGVANDGDVYKTENIISFSHHVHELTGEGVHFMMADGGFSVEGRENIQEILSKRIYLCQFLVALSIVRSNGHFVCKLFDIFTPFSAGLVYIMYRCFKRISIHKPNTSRPANSERYIICKWKLNNVDHITDYLLHVNKEFDKYGEASYEEINEIVPLDIMKNDEQFYNYLQRSNNMLGERQCNSLAKVVEFSENEYLVEERQVPLVKECLEAWRIEIGARKDPSLIKTEYMIRNVLNINNTDWLAKKSGNINEYKLENVLISIHDWHAVILGADSKSGGAACYLGVSHKKCFKYDRSSKKWISVPDTQHLKLELSPGTLVYGEIVAELIGESRGQRKIYVFHIIDGHTLGGINISHLCYTERIKECSLYAKALNRPSMHNVMSIRMKQVYELDELETNSFYNMKSKIMKNIREKQAVPLMSGHSEQFYIPMGIMFLKSTKLPYMKYFSNTSGDKFYWRPPSEIITSEYKVPREALNDFRCTYEKSITWFVNEDDNKPFNEQLFILELVKYIRTNRTKKKYEKKDWDELDRSVSHT